MRARGHFLNRRRGLVLPPNLAWDLNTAALPVVETVTIPPGHGSGTYDITAIGGITVDKFTHIQVFLDGVSRSSSGSQMQLQLRQQGGAYGDETYVSHQFNSVNVNRDTSTFDLLNDTTTTTQNNAIWLENVSEACPTIIRSTDLDVSVSFPGIRDGVTAGVVVHDAIRFLAGSGNWDGGDIHLVGYRLRVGELFTLSWAGESSQNITLNKGEYLASIVNHNIGTSASSNIRVRIGTGGTFETTGYRFYLGDSVGTQSGDTTFMSGNQSGEAAAARYGFLSLYNMQTSTVPVMGFAKCIGNDGTDSNPQEVRGYMRTDTVDYDQIQVDVNTGTVDSGTTYIQTYKPKQTIHAIVDLSTDGGTTITTSGLKRKNSSLLLCGGHDIDRASASNAALYEVGSGSLDTGSNYLNFQSNEGFDNSASATGFIGTDFTSRTAAAHVTLITGVAEANCTYGITHDLVGGGTTSLIMSSGVHNVDQSNDRIGIVSTPAFNSGTYYVVGYA